MIVDGISVLMPVYLPDRNSHRELLLYNAIRSVLDQECPVPVELLLINDGSFINISQLLIEFGLTEKSNIRVISNPINLKLVASLNIGLKAARFGFIARLDADDLWLPGKLAAQISEFQKHPNLTLSATSMKLDFLEEPNLNRDEIRFGGWSEAHRLFHKLGCPFPHGSIVARKDIFELFGGYPTTPLFAHCEDFALWSNWIRFFQTSILETPYLIYRVSSHGVSSQFSNSQNLGSRIVSQKYFELGLKEDYCHLMEDLASSFNLSDLVLWGKILACAWLYFDNLIVDDGLISKFQEVLPDRNIIGASSKDKIKSINIGYLFKTKRFLATNTNDIIQTLMNPE